ncbi:hypothetical protein U1Q18_047935, partial [Sarracenia purpurea var. burkii]
LVVGAVKWLAIWMVVESVMWLAVVCMATSGLVVVGLGCSAGSDFVRVRLVLGGGVVVLDFGGLASAGLVVVFCCGFRGLTTVR